MKQSSNASFSFYFSRYDSLCINNNNNETNNKVSLKKPLTIINHKHFFKKI